MAVPEDPTIVKLRRALEAGYDMLRDQAQEYDGQRRNFRRIKARLTKQERRVCREGFKQLRQLMEQLMVDLSTFQGRLALLVQQEWNAQVQEELAGLDAELQRLWEQHRS